MAMDETAAEFSYGEVPKGPDICVLRRHATTAQPIISFRPDKGQLYISANHFSVEQMAEMAKEFEDAVEDSKSWKELFTALLRMANSKRGF